jgi:hypothetical protein
VQTGPYSSPEKTFHEVLLLGLIGSCFAGCRNNDAVTNQNRNIHTQTTAGNDEIETALETDVINAMSTLLEAMDSQTNQDQSVTNAAIQDFVAFMNPDARMRDKYRPWLDSEIHHITFRNNPVWIQGNSMSYSPPNMIIGHPSLASSRPLAVCFLCDLTKKEGWTFEEKKELLKSYVYNPFKVELKSRVIQVSSSENSINDTSLYS